MTRSADDILADIDAFRPANGFWRPFDNLLAELWSVGVTERALPVLFHVFERFPEDDGTGVLWSIVHGLEHLEIDYGPALRSSLARQPSLMGHIMQGRLERSGAG